MRETYRRSGGATPRLDFAALTALYEQQLARVTSMDDFRRARLRVDADSIVPREVRERWASLPSTVSVRGRDVEIHYDVEDTDDGPRGVARLKLPEKIARTLTEQELPTLDRPLRFIVTRGARGAARADTLDALQDELERPFTQEELAALDRARDTHQRGRHAQRGRDGRHGRNARGKRRR